MLLYVLVFQSEVSQPSLLVSAFLNSLENVWSFAWFPVLGTIMIILTRIQGHDQAVPRAVVLLMENGRAYLSVATSYPIVSRSCCTHI